MKRVPEVIDCWFDSGSMPFAQHHYPFENQELFQQQFPADFISEAVDQTRGWFYSLLAISTLLFNQAPYRNVLVLGHVQDENGQKMSKSKGNAVDPFQALESYGADAIRWYFYSNSAPWLPNRFHGKAVQEGQRKFMSTLWNTYAFFVLYANIDDFDASRYTLDRATMTVMDRWLLSRLNTLIATVDGHLENYRIPEAARALQDFVEEMSNWYVRRSRERFWAKGMEPDKISAYMTLYTALVTVAKVAAPMIPFMCEDIYRNLVCSVDSAAPESVHLCDYPVCDASFVDEELEREMESVLEIVTLGRAARNTANRKNRQPLAAVYVRADRKIPASFQEIVREELNVKEFRYVEDASQFVSYTFKPQLKILGQKYGKKIGDIRTALAALDGSQAKKELDEAGAIAIQAGGETIRLTAEELLIETAQTDGYVTAEDWGTSVVLDTTLTDELIEEGFVREITSKIQSMRKDAGFDVMDHIVVYQKGSERVAEILRNHREEIASDVLAEDICLGELEGFTAAWNLNGEEVELGVKKM